MTVAPAEPPAAPGPLVSAADEFLAAGYDPFKTPAEPVDDDDKSMGILLAVAAAFLVARQIAIGVAEKREARDMAEAAMAFQAAQQAFSGTYLEQSLPALQMIYAEGPDPTGMAFEHASRLAEYLAVSSTNVAHAAYLAGLNDGVPSDMSFLRALSGFGLNGPQMRRWLPTARGENGKSSAVVTDRGRRMLALLLPQRANKVAEQETFVARAHARLSRWMWWKASGKVPADAEQQWLTSADERVCPVCAPLHKQVVPVGTPWKVADKEIWGPGVHPNCRCRVQLIVPGLVMKGLREEIAKAKTTAQGRWDPYDRGPGGKFAPSESRAARPTVYAERIATQMDPAVARILQQAAQHRSAPATSQPAAAPAAPKPSWFDAPVEAPAGPALRAWDTYQPAQPASPEPTVAPPATTPSWLDTPVEVATPAQDLSWLDTPTEPAQEQKSWLDEAPPAVPNWWETEQDIAPVPEVPEPVEEIPPVEETATPEAPWVPGSALGLGNRFVRLMGSTGTPDFESVGVVVDHPEELRGMVLDLDEMLDDPVTPDGLPVAAQTIGQVVDEGIALQLNDLARDIMSSYDQAAERTANRDLDLLHRMWEGDVAPTVYGGDGEPVPHRFAIVAHMLSLFNAVDEDGANPLIQALPHPDEDEAQLLTYQAQQALARYSEYGYRWGWDSTDDVEEIAVRHALLDHFLEQALYGMADDKPLAEAMLRAMYQQARDQRLLPDDYQERSLSYNEGQMSPEYTPDIDPEDAAQSALTMLAQQMQTSAVVPIVFKFRDGFYGDIDPANPNRHLARGQYRVVDVTRSKYASHPSSLPDMPDVFSQDPRIDQAMYEAAMMHGEFVLVTLLPVQDLEQGGPHRLGEALERDPYGRMGS